VTGLPIDQGTPVGRGAGCLAALIAAAGRRGIASARLLAGTGVSARELADATCAVSCESEHRAIENFVNLGGDVPCAGLEVGAGYRFTTLGPLGFAMVSCPTLADATRLVADYGNLFDPFVRLHVRGEADRIRLTLRPVNVAPELSRFIMERAVGALLTLWRDVARRSVTPLELSFGFARPLDDRGYSRFAGVAVQFGSETQLSVGTSEMAQPLPHADSYALRMAESQCRQLRDAARETESIVGRVRALVRARQGGGLPDMAEVASALCMSERTLRRRLQREGTTFASLCNAMREVAAEQLLSCRHLPIEHIAERLGYAEPASFIHAFKRWKGQTPHAFRLETPAEAAS